MRVPTTAAAVLLLVGCGTLPAPAGAPDGTAPGPAQEVGARTTVLQPPGEPPQLCLSSVQESYPPQCSGPEVLGWDWDALAPGTWESASGTTWGDFLVVGTWDGEALTLTRSPLPPEEGQHLLPLPAPRPPTEVPCPEPAGGWAPVDPARTTSTTLDAAAVVVAGAAGSAGTELVRLDGPPPEVDEEQPLDLARIVLLARTAGDAAALEGAVRQVWGGALCVVEVPRSSAELQALSSRLSGHPEFMGGGPDERTGQVRMLVARASEALQRELDADHGPGVVRLEGALQPVLPDP